jgi:Fe2+ or Zn2+ uptake regulation protein
MSESQGKPVVEEVLLSVFSELGQRNSAPRRAMAEELAQLAASREGFTAQELQQRLLKSGATVGRATIFRAIRQLADRGVLDCIDFEDGTRLYRVCGERILDADKHHHHMACKLCHRIVDFQFCFPKDQLDQLGDKEGFLIQGHSLTLYGVCNKCRSSATKKTRAGAEL